MERIELPPKVLETPMIPFHHTPTGFINEVGDEKVALIPIHHTPNINGRLYKRPFMLSFTDNSVKSVIVILIY